MTNWKFKTWLNGKLNNYSKEDRKAFGFCYLMILIPVVQFAIFWVYVNLDSILLDFKIKTDSLLGIILKRYLRRLRRRICTVGMLEKF